MQPTSSNGESRSPRQNVPPGASQAPESSRAQGGPQTGSPSGTAGVSQAGAQTGGAVTQGAGSGTRGMPRRSGGEFAGGGAGNPFNTMMQLSREMDRLWDSFFGRSFGAPSRLFGSWPAPDMGGTGAREGAAPTLWSPHIDVRQRGDAIVIHADLPGVRKEDVHIEATDEGLAISGERQQQREEGERSEGYRFAERSYGSFYRSIPLPEGAQVEQARARMSEGVLELTVPVQRPQQRRIPIE